MTVGEVAATLDRLHAHGLTHRGLTPENILFDFSGRTCISDIGIADSLLAAKADTVRGRARAGLRSARVASRADR